MKKIIGIIARYDKNITNKDVFIMYDKFKNIILDNNFLVLNIIPTTLNIEKDMTDDEIVDFYQLLNLCNGIILQGGDKFYDYDKRVVEYCIKKDKPILGICLGMQTMACIHENNLDKLKTDFHNSLELFAHKIQISKDSKLYEIINEDEIMVNSYHKEYIKDSGIYNVSAISIDNIIEAIEYNQNRFNIGVQFHPEKTYYIDVNMKKIFNKFFESIRD